MSSSATRSPSVIGSMPPGLGEIDPVGWTEAEWSRRLAASDPFAELVAREGIAVERPAA